MCTHGISIKLPVTNVTKNSQKNHSPFAPSVQRPQEAKLRDGKVRGIHGLTAFGTGDANTHMCLLDP